MHFENLFKKKPAVPEFLRTSEFTKQAQKFADSLRKELIEIFPQPISRNVGGAVWWEVYTSHENLARITQISDTILSLGDEQRTAFKDSTGREVDEVSAELLKGREKLGSAMANEATVTVHISLDTLVQDAAYMPGWFFNILDREVSRAKPQYTIIYMDDMHSFFNGTKPVSTVVTFHAKYIFTDKK